MEIARDYSRGAKAIVVLCVIALSGAMGGWQLTARPLGDHEGYVAVTAREMLRSGDWVVPRCNGELRLEKTPLNYWLVAAVGKARGGVDEFAAKLPSVLLAMLSTVGVLYFVSVWLGFRTAAISAAVWSTSLGFVRYAHSTRPEMSLTCFVTIAMLAFCCAIASTERKKQIAYMLIFWLSFAVAMLAKGPAPLPLIGAPLLLYFVIFRYWKKIPKMLPVVGGVLFIGIVLAWPIMLALRLTADAGSGGASGVIYFWKTEFVDRFMGTHAKGNKPNYYYFYVMFQFMVPWVTLVPMALAAPFYKVWGQKQKAMLLLWLWFAADVVFMTLSGGKRRHYILPAMPAMAILIGILLEDMIFIRTAYTGKFARNAGVLHAGAIVVGAIAAPIYIMIAKVPGNLAAVIVLSVGALVVVSAVVVLFKKAKNIAATATIFAGYSVLLMFAYASFVAPNDPLRYTKRLAQNVAAEIAPAGNLTAYGDVTMRFVYYFGDTVPVAEELSQAYQRYTEGDWIVAGAGYMDELVEDGRFEIARFWADSEYAHGKIVDAAVFHKPTTAVEIEESTDQ